MTGADARSDGPSVSQPTSARLTTVRDAAALAAAFGSPIYEPAVWPDGVTSVSYVLETFDSTGHTAYRIEGRQTGHLGPSPIRVIGRQGRTSVRAGYAGWERTPLAQFTAAFSRQRAGSTDLALQHSDQAIQLLGYPSPKDAVAAANSLSLVSARTATDCPPTTPPTP